MSTGSSGDTEHASGGGHHPPHHHVEESYPGLRVRALESLLVEKGLIASDTVDALVQAYEQDIGPMNGAQVVARAWVDPAYRERLLANGAEAIAELGYGGIEGSEIRVLENTPEVHNVVVCTLCSCYPWPVLGLPPSWYKSHAYRSRTVIEPPGGTAGVRSGAGRFGGGAGLGQQRRCPVHGPAPTPARQRRNGRVGAGRPGDSGFHDRCRAGANTRPRPVELVMAIKPDQGISGMEGDVALPRRNGELLLALPGKAGPSA